jgi:hypothetical protein
MSTGQAQLAYLPFRQRCCVHNGVKGQLTGNVLNINTGQRNESKDTRQANEASKEEDSIQRNLSSGVDL